MNKPKVPINYQEEIILKNKYWADIISKWDLTLGSVKLFCNNNKINRDQFYYWRNKLSKHTAIEPQHSTNFIEINNSSQAIGGDGLRLKTDILLLLDIMLPNKISITIRVPTVELSQVIQQIGGLSC